MSDAVLPQSTVRRWRRFGKDRLYVSDPDGRTVGYWDLATGEAHPESADQAEALAAAVESWTHEHEVQHLSSAAVLRPDRAAAGPPEPGPGADALPISPVPGPSVPDLSLGDWTDLAENCAGAQARAQAVAARRAAPVRTLLARALRVHTDERAWRIGAEGEEKVAAQLARVASKDRRWRFLHAIPVGERGSDIDHLVVGPGGVFTVNAKNHPGARIWVGGNTLMVNGTRQPYVRNSRHEAARATRLLSAATASPVQVTGLIVPVNAHDVVVKQTPDDGVVVVPRRQLARWLLRRDEVVGDEALDIVYDAARRSTTWRA